MRVVCRVFADGSRQVYKTDNNGQNLEYIEGDDANPKRVRRIVASIEAIYNDSDRAAVTDALRKLELLLPARVA